MSTPRSLSSREKKTVRDRRAQVARRARQAAHIQRLEEQVEHCRREHAKHIELEQETATLRAALDAVTRECAELRRRQTAVLHLLTPSCHDPTSDPSAKHEDDRHEIHNPHHTTTWEEPAGGDWAQLPSNTSHDDLVLTMTPWLLCPAVVLPLSDLPSPCDLLSGSQSNPLANSIHIAVTNAYTRKLADPDRLAWGWLSYIYTKWVLHPTPARYARLPHFLRPTELQKSRTHSPVIDFIVWPQLRDNLISTCSSKEDVLAALFAIAPLLKVSWPTNTPLLEPDPANPSQLAIRPDFLATITQLENWTVPANFMSRYPDLAGGIHWSPTTSLPLIDNDEPAEERLKAR